MSAGASGKRNRRGGRLWKVLAFGGGLVALLVIVALIFAPAIASGFAPGFVRNAAGKAMSGSVDVDRVALSWRGPQKISGLRVTGPDGGRVADVSLEASTSLIGLIRGSRDLGAIRVSGEVIVEKDKDGQTTLARAIEPPPPPPGAPARPSAPAKPTGGPSTLPRGLAAALVIDGLTLTYRDASGGAMSDVKMPGLKGSASFEVGQPIVVSIDGSGTVDGRPSSLQLNATIDKWSTLDGRATPDLATIDASVKAVAPGALIGALASMPGSPEINAIAQEWAGDANATASIEASAKGDAQRLLVDLKAALPGAQADVGLALTDLASGGTARAATTRPAQINASVSPSLFAKLAPDSGAALRAPLRVQTTLEAMAPIPAGGALDLHDASLTANVSLSEIAADVRIEGEPKPRAVRLAPTTARVDGVNLRQGVALALQTSATVDGESAGAINVDLTGEGVLDANGAPQAPRALRGRAAITGLSTSLAQPFVRDAGLELAKDVGPTLDLSLTAVPTSGGAPKPGELPPTDITLSARAANVRLDGALRMEGDVIRSGPQGIRATIADAGPLARRVLAENSGMLAEGVPLSVAANVTDLEATLPAGGATFDLRKVRASANASVKGIAAIVENERIDVPTLDLAATLLPDEPPRSTLRASASHDRKPFTVEADMAIEGLFGPDGSIQAANARPVGTLAVRDAPVSLARVGGLGDLLDLIRTGVGDTVALSARSTPAANNASDVVIEVAAANARATARATLTRDAIELAGAEATAQVTPALVSQAMRKYAPDMTRAPKLDRAVEAKATLGSARIPLKDGKPDLVAAGNIAATLGLSGPLVLRGLDAGEGRTVDVSLDGVKATASAPLSGKGRIEGSLDAGLFDPSRAGSNPVGIVAAKGVVTGAGEQQSVEGSVRVQRLETAYVDALLGKPGFLALAVGETADVQAEAKPSPGGATALAATIKSPRLNASLAGSMQQDRVSLTSPAEARWNISEQWINRFALAADASSVTLLGDVPVDLRVERATFARGEGPMKPGVFDLSASAVVNGASLATADGQRARIERARVTVASGAPGTLTVDASLSGVRNVAGDSGDATLRATLTNLADSRGVVTPDRAQATATIDGTVPTALVDALADQKGLLLEALGPTTTLKATANGLSREGGTLSAHAVAPRAEARIVGEVRNGLFVSSQPVSATIHEITPAMSQRVIESIFPLLTRMEKRRADGPAVATVTNLQLPTRAEIDSNNDGVPDKSDLRKLNADIRVELGRMSYTTNDLFSGILKATKNKTEGQLFNRFPPIDVRVRDGVAHYDRTAFPIGEFTVETRGKVDLAKREMDLIVYVPIIGLVDEAVGIFRAAPGFNDAAPVPFRMKGPIGKAVPVPAPDLMIKEAIKAPGKILEEVGKGIEDLFKKK